MNNTEAKRILITWRAGQIGQDDPLVAEALQQARRDPVLRQWFQQHMTFQQEVSETLRQIPVPRDLKDKILARAKTIKPVHWWQQPRWVAAAAVVALLLGLAAFWFRPAPEDSFNVFRSRMVRTVLRQYSMDIETRDMTQVRQFLATNNAPADYVLPQGLARAPALGAGLLSWQDRRVSMVCLESADRSTLFLFIVDRTSVKPQPPSTPQFAQVSKLMTASWSQGDKVYILAASGNRETLQRLF